jgi:hypothetical protein
MPASTDATAMAMPASIHVSNLADELGFGSARSWIAYGAGLKREAILLPNRVALRMPTGHVEIEQSAARATLESVGFLPLSGEYLADS